MTRNGSRDAICPESPGKSRFLAVKNFEVHQHYKDRRPLWIKLYNTLLDDPEFIALGDSARSHLMLLWLIASRHRNRIPYDVKYIQRATHARSRIDLQALIDSGWLTVVFGQPEPSTAPDPVPASNLLADCYQPASPEKRRGEKSREEAAPSSSARAIAPVDPGLVEVLGAEHGEAFDRHIAEHLGRPRIGAFVAEMRAVLSGGGIHGITCTVEQLRGATIDYLTNTVGTRPNLSHFRGYLRKAGAPARRSPAGGNGPPRRVQKPSSDAWKLLPEPAEP